MTMPVPPTLTSYLPVLLVSVTHSAAPDDTSFSTLPEGQVDYLSHNWREEDVWRSWRNMTRQKNAIANGMRLENASWRTWWKQRNKLKTISPETLNWLKDSDVTWLYGPLHTGSDWSPVASRSPESLQAKQRQNSLSAIPGNIVVAPVTQPKKPILKRRSIGQLLSLPSSTLFEQYESDEDVAAVDGMDSDAPKRPPLLHTKSDTHISWRLRPHRKDSPPRIIAEEGSIPTVRDAPTTSARTSAALSDAFHSTSSDTDLSGGSSVSVESPAGGSTTSETSLKKKHISFNTFVEQCIAIEKPNAERQPTGRRRSPVFSCDDGYDEDSEATNEDDDDVPTPYYQSRPATVNSDSDDDDDDVLEMRTSSSRLRTSSSTGSLPRKLTFDVDAPRTPHPHLRPSLVRRPSAGGEHVSIAPIAPTLLKGTGVGNNLGVPGLPAPVAKDVDLVYAPPSNSNYSMPGSPNLTQEDVYQHRESYFSVGTSPSPSQTHSPSSSPPIPTVGALPPPPQLSSSPPKYEVQSRSFFPRQSYAESPARMDTVVEDAFDYFDGPPVLNENYAPEWSQREHSKGVSDNATGAIPARYAEGGAASVTTGRSSGLVDLPPSYSPGHSPETPVVVVNEVNGAMEERTERSREASPLRTGEQPSSPPTFVHSAPVAVPCIGATHPHISFSPQVADASLLSPSISPCRGRTLSSPACGSVSGSTTTGSTNYTRSTDSRSDSRGRSLTRSASYSDRERSSSRGTSSPMGSLSPTGSALALGNGPVHAKGRERSRRIGSDESERGRERTGRALAASVSPPSLVNSPTRAAREGSESSTAPPDAPQSNCEPSSPPSSVSGSSTASSSTARQPHARDSTAAPRPRIHVSTQPNGVLPIPSPIPEEDEQWQAGYPTPANSPVTTLKPTTITSPKYPPAKSEQQPTTSTSHAEGHMAPTNPVAIPRSRDRAARSSLDGQQETTLAGRAADMVSSARGLLGSIWNAGTA